MAALLKLLEKIAEAAAENASRGPACKQASKAALEQIAKPATGKSGIRCIAG